MHRTSEHDTIYIYDTSDRFKRELHPVDLEISFFLITEMISDFSRLSYVN